jgi:hypothetical protein
MENEKLREEKGGTYRKIKKVTLDTFTELRME